MRVPIPDDWNGIDWHCIQIEWPESPQWTGLLIGILTLLTRGRYWDERTGTITDVQAIAREIFDRAYPFVSCDGDTITPPVLPDLPSGYGGGNSLDDEESENDMPAVTWLEIDENGTLYMYFGPCCKIEVGGDFAIAVDPPPTDTNDETPPSETWACNKAAGIAENLATAMVDVLAVMSPLGALNEQTNACKNALAAFGAVWSDCREIALAYRADSVNIDTMVADAETEEWLACLYAPLIANTDNISGAEYFTLQSAPSSHFSASEALFIRWMVVAIGQPALAWWARMTHDIVADCSCEGLGPVEASSIFFNGSFDVPAPGTCVLEEYSVHDGGRRAHFTLAGSGGNYRNMADIRAHLTGAELGDTVTFRIYNNPASGDFMPAYEWFAYSTPAPPTDWVYLETVGGNPTTRQTFSNYVEWTSDDDPAALPTKMELVDCRFYPDNPGLPGGWYTKWWVEIVAVNGVRLTPIGP